MLDYNHHLISIYHYAAPTIQLHPKNITVHKGDVAVLEVKVTGATPMYYQWYHDGRLLDGMCYYRCRI